MSKMTYLDFDLLIERSEHGYMARVLRGPAGTATAEFSKPFSDLEVENFVLRMGHQRQRVRRIESPEMKGAKEFGARLFEAIFRDQVFGCFHSGLDKARQQEAGLRIRLRLTDVPELADLPWEYLYNRSLNRFLALSSETPLVRYLDLPESIRPLAVKPPLKALVMISSPSDRPGLDVEQEWTKLGEALTHLEQQVLMAPERLENASLAALQQQLRQGEYHVFHFIGHGGFDPIAQDGMLALEDENKQSHLVSGQHLGMVLHDHRSLRLVILNACEGARSSRVDPFAGTAQSLIQQGIPAVIAMQFPITDEAAITFSKELYSTLSDGYPVDAALSEARKAIFAQGNEVEWGTPVLYLRSPDGRIFDIASVSSEERRRIRIDALYYEAQAAMTRKDWATAVQKLQTILDLDPTHAEAKFRLSRAGQQLKLATLYAKGRKHYQATRWREALAYLRQVQEIGGAYRDVETLIDKAQKAQRKEEKSSMPRNILSWFSQRPGAIILAAVLLLIGVVAGGAVIIGSVVPRPTATPIWTPAGESSVTPTRQPNTPEPQPTVTPVPTVAPTWTATPTPAPTAIPDMIRIPPGFFVRGSTDAQIEAIYQECLKMEVPNQVSALCWRRLSDSPQREIYLDAFDIDIYEVTNAQYNACVQAGACSFPISSESNTRHSYLDNPDYAGYPVIHVTWQDASDYCTWAGKRLPTEAEWEKAARGTNGLIWPWGNGWSQARANVRSSKIAPDTGDTAPVGSYPSGDSPYGIMDMTGNVWEWVADWYDKEYYESAPDRNPQGPSSGDKKVIRGGSWNSNILASRATHRAPAPTGTGYPDIGFRCARNP